MIEHAQTTFSDMKRKLLDHIRSLFPVRGKEHILELSDVNISGKLDQGNYKAQKDARMTGKTWSIPVKASFILKDMRGKVIDRSTMKIIDLPHLTNRGSYIVGGSEYMFPAQKRLRSGPYVRSGQNDELRTFFNMAKGRNFYLGIHPTKHHFQLQVDTSKNIPLYPVLKALGVTDDAMVRAWGRDVFVQNRQTNPAMYNKALKTAYEKMSYGAKAPENVAQALREIFESTEMDGDNTELTLGKKLTSANGTALLLASSKMLRVAREEEPEDDRDNLIHNDIVDLSDYVVERFKDRQFRDRIRRTIIFNVDRRDKISQIISRDAFQRPVNSLFTESQLSLSPTQTNPMGMMSDYTAITVRGEGGIQQDNALTRNVRALNPSHLGFLDTAHTPEGQGVGTTLHLSIGTRKQGKKLVSRVLDVRKNKVVECSPTRLWKSTVAFPEALSGTKLKPGRHKVSRRGKIETVDSKQIDYAFLMPEHLMDANTASIPFVSHTNGARVMLASKLGVQAKPLVGSESPMVRSATTGGKTVEGSVGRAFSPKSPVSGTVEKVTDDEIVISGHKVSLPNNFPLNNNNFFSAKAIVKVGDKVKRGQVIADTNYTKNGKLAMGKNLLVAYTPYKGMNVEDAVVVSRSAAAKMTSEHLYQQPYTFGVDTVMDLKRFSSYFPTKLKEEQAQKLDERGVIKKGQVVQPGDILVAAMRKQELGTEGQRMAKISKILAKEFRDDSMVWEKDVVGKVVDIANRANEVVIHIKTQEPLRVGDKLVGRHANKGIVGHILEDDEMPKDAKGRTIDLLLNPNGVVSRMNLGQILETTASRISEKTGKPYLAKGFGGADTLQKELKKHGLKDHETIYDPKENEHIPGILVGHQYIYKLEHQVTKKTSARGGGVDEEYTSEEQPTRGKHGGRAIGSMELYAMLAHGSLANIHEMYGVKSSFDPEAWRAIESGAPLPPLKTAYAQERFSSMLKGMGIDLKRQGNNVTMVPFLDKHVKELSSGEITDHKLIRGKDLREEKNGLFDTKKTGGVRGDRWSHVKLPEPIPNPTFEKAITSILHLKKSEFDDIISEKGGAEIKSMLEKVDVNKRLTAAKKQIVGKKGAELNSLHKEIRYLKTLKKNGIKPKEYVIERLPVIPPKFRPIYTLPDGSLNVSDVNFHYQSALQLSNQIKEMKGTEFKDQRRKLNTELYKAVGGVMGLNEGVVERAVPPKGLAKVIGGAGSPKGGYLHSRLLKKRQDISASNVIVPNPKLGIDEVGLPEATAWKTFRPFLIRELRTMGMTPLQARKAVDDKTPQARKALEKVVKERHVILNRAPTLHKFSVMAFKPKLVSGHALEIPPTVVGGFGADFDGDEVLAKIFVYIPKNVVRDSSQPEAWWRHRWIGGSEDMAARFGVLTSVWDDGDFYIVDLEEFPHEQLVDKQKDIDVYAVRKGIKVLAMDETNGQIQLADVMFWTFHRQKEIVIINLGGNRQTMTDDDPRAVFGIDPKTMTYGRWRPSEAVGKMVPMAKSIDIPTTLTELKVCDEPVKMDRDSGWFLGATTGDGWVEHANDKPTHVCIGSTYEDIREKWQKTSQVFLNQQHIGRREHDRESIDGITRKMTALIISNVKFASFMVDLIGRGSKNKHLPPCTFAAPRDFRLGLLEGLLDTDGSCSWNRSRPRPQFLCSYSTSSSRLARELVLLCRSLDISASITSHKYKNNDRQTYIINMSSPDIHRSEIKLIRENKQLALKEFRDQEAPVVKGRSTELVPLGGDATQVAMRLCRANGDNTSYSACSAAKTKNGYVSRSVGEKIISYAQEADEFPDELLRFKDLIDNKSVTWLPVLGFENTGIFENGYDLTVPGHETFMSVDGVILSNTMGIHVPISAEANAEAANMLPSKHLYKPGSKKLQPKIEHEYVLGLFKISKPGPVVARRFSSTGEVLSSLKARKIAPNAAISVTGIGSTTPGRILINESLPMKLRDYGQIWEDKSIQKKLIEVDKAAGRQAFARVLGEWAQIGRRYAYLTGSSFLLSDLQTMTKQRNEAYRRADKMADRIRMGSGSEKEKKRKIVELYMTVSGGLANRVAMKKNQAGKSNNIMDMMEAGARGNPTQVRQMVSNVGVMMDHENRPMTEPVRGTYTEGLDTAEFFQHMYGNRKGMIDRSQSVKDPGALTKQVIVSAAGFRISSIDCNTSNGIQESTIGDSALDRYLAESIKGVGSKNTLVTSSTLALARGKGIKQIKVRSPLTCKAAVGVCAHCYGLNEEGRLPPIGDHVGIKDAQGLTEPSTQLAMKTFHSGGVASGKKDLTSGFDRVKQLFTMPENISKKATLSEMNGRVDAIRQLPQGGSVVQIAGRQHRVARGRKVIVKVGDIVKRGDKITDGNSAPQDVMKLRGLRAMQTQLRDDIQNIYASGGQHIHAKTIETPVRMLTETVRISEPGDHPSLITGDYSTYGRVDSWNREHMGKRPVRYTHQLPGSEYLPHRSDDWAKRMAHNRIQQVLTEAPAMGAKTTLQGDSPYASLLFGEKIKRDPWSSGGLVNG